MKISIDTKVTHDDGTIESVELSGDSLYTPAVPQPEPEPEPVPPPTVIPLFADSFNYIAAKDNPDVVDIFRAHGWSGAKTEQDPYAGNPRGYMYTTDNIPGYTGDFPGHNSTHVLAMEALISSMGGQSSINIRYGTPESPNTTIPENIWFLSNIFQAS